MKIKILAGEYLISEQGTHICDSNGFAMRAEEDTECEIKERVDVVLEIIKNDRLNHGLDENGNPIPEPIIETPFVEQSISASPAVEE
mgnify:CR=1 FL=1|jgi:hypothetical protein